MIREQANINNIRFSIIANPITRLVNVRIIKEEFSGLYERAAVLSNSIIGFYHPNVVEL